MRRSFALPAVLAIVASSMVASVGHADVDEVGRFEQTKTVTREFVEPDGARETVASHDVTVKVDHTVNLRGRERVEISWSGARPSAARSADPFGPGGMTQEYPVVILQCRGSDRDSVPEQSRMRPETCFTTSRQQRSQQVANSAAVWRLDPFAKEDQRGSVSGVDKIPTGCDVPAESIFSLHLTEFIAADGTVYPACSAETMPPEAGVDDAFPAAEQAAFTGLDGTGSTSFEVRSSIENESLGCSDTTACNIVVIPIEGLSCLTGEGKLAAASTACRAEGKFEPGSSNFAGTGVDNAVSGLYWWSESNWRNRITVPITFGTPPNVCDVLDDRAPVGFYGTELLSQASLQWAPAYCLRKDRFKFQHNVQPDQASYTLMENQEAPGAFVSGRQEGDKPAEYAPLAVTGWALSYAIDKPNNTGEYGDLRLNARLLAKLLTQSYPASALGKGHPGLENNPLSMPADPEFQALNPGLTTTAIEEAAVLMTLSESSDVIKSMTQYIATDPEAAAFIDGQPDPWGMTINPNYENIEVPRDKWPLLDDYKPQTQQACLQQNNDVAYLTRLAAPVTNFRKVAEAVLDAWPLAQTRCTGQGNELDPYVIKRATRQGVGSRFIIGVTTLGDAERFGLRTAALQTSRIEPGSEFSDTSGRTFVKASRDAMAAAVSTAKQAKRGQPFDLDMTTLRRADGAYPGTMIIYTAALIAGLDKTTASTVASFIRIASTEGQVPGTGNGKLPDGFVPIVASGATKALYTSARQVADDIEGQVGATPQEDEETPAPADDAPISGDVETPPLDSAPPVGDAVDSADAAATGDAAPKADAKLRSLGTTPAASSFVAGIVLPALIIIALLGSLVGFGLRVVGAVRRPR